MDSTELQFDAESHTYNHDGAPIPGVTTVLQCVGLSDYSMVPEEILAQAQALGTEVHEACENHDNKNPQQRTLSEISCMRLCHYISFLNDYKVKIIEVEKKVFCKRYRYAGTLDRVMSSESIGVVPFILDIKTGPPMPSYRIQTAAYERAYAKDKRTWLPRYCLYLKDDGYKLSEEQKSRDDFGVFLGALNVHNYKLGAK